MGGRGERGGALNSETEAKGKKVIFTRYRYIRSYSRACSKKHVREKGKDSLADPTTFLPTSALISILLRTSGDRMYREENAAIPRHVISRF